jgi:hypothetical protein
MQQATVFAYNPQTDSWTRKADMPTARRWLTLSAVDGLIYAIGGGGWASPVLDVVEAYDPQTDTWATNKSRMPTARFTFASCAVNGIIYAIGGGDNSMNALATVEAYDPKVDQWTTKQPLPKPIGGLAASVVDGTIYVFKGTETFAYDPKTDRWSAKAGFMPWRSWLTSSEVDGIVYLFGGVNEGYYGLSSVLAYDPAQDRFSARRKMPRTRAFGASAVVDAKIYLMGGANDEPIVHPAAIFYDIFEEFDPQGGVTPEILNPSCESSNHVRLLWQGEAGIRYGVESTAQLANGLWTRMSFSGGGNSVLATNSLVETTCVVPTADSNRFFRVFELQSAR